MEEALKTARAAHHFIVLIAAAIGALVVSSSSASDYRQALVEIRKLSSLSEPSYVAEVNRLGRQARAHLAIEDVTEAAVGSLGASLARDQNGAWATALPVSADLPPLSGTLAEIRAFLESGPQRVSILVPETAQLTAGLAGLLEQRTADELRGRVAVFSFMPPEADGVETMMECDSMTYTVTFETTPPSAAPFLQSEVMASAQVLSTSAFSDWLKRSDENRSLWGTDGGALPASSRVWDEISDDTPDGAIKTLREKIEATRGSIDVLGISIEGTLILGGGPLVLVVALLYLRSNVNHLRRVSSTADGDMRAFPWIALFEDDVSYVGSNVSLLLLPTAVIVGVFYRYPEAVARPVFIASIVVGCVLVASVVTITSIERLRTQVGLEAGRIVWKRWLHQIGTNWPRGGGRRR